MLSLAQPRSNGALRLAEGLCVTPERYRVFFRIHNDHIVFLFSSVAAFIIIEVIMVDSPHRFGRALVDWWQINFVYACDRKTTPTQISNMSRRAEVFAVRASAMRAYEYVLVETAYVDFLPELTYASFGTPTFVVTMETRERIYETGLGHSPPLSGAQIGSCRSGGGIATGGSRLPKATLSLGALVAAWIALYLNGQAPRTDGTASTVAAFVVHRRVSNGASHRINNTISLLILNDDFTARATDSFIFSSSLSSSPTQLYLHSLSSPTTEERVDESISDSSDFPSISLSQTPLSLKGLRVWASEPAVRSIRVDQLSRVALPLRENSFTEAKLTASLVRSETGMSNGTRNKRPFLESSSPKLNVNYSALLHSAPGFQHPQAAVDEVNGDLSVLRLTGKNPENSALQEPTQRHMDETKISATLFWHRLTSLKRLPPSLSTDPNPSEIIVTKSTAIPPVEGANSTSTQMRSISNATAVGPTNYEHQAKLVSMPSESLSSTSVQLISSRARFVGGPEACPPSHASLSLDSPHVRVLNGPMRAPPLQKGYDAAIKVFFGFLRPRGVLDQTSHAQAKNVQGFVVDSKREASKNLPVADVGESLSQESVSPARIKSTDVSRDARNNEVGMEAHRSTTDVISKQVQVDGVRSITAGSVSLSVTSTRRHLHTSKYNYGGDRQASTAPESLCSSVLIRGDSRLAIAASSNSAQRVLALVHVPKPEPRWSSVSGLTASAPTARAAEERNSSLYLTQPLANVDSEPLRVDEHVATTAAPESLRDPLALVCDSVSSAEGESVATSLVCNLSQITSLASESKLIPLSDIGHMSSGKQTTVEDSPTEHLGYDYVLTRIAAFVSRSRIPSPPRVDAVRSEANNSSHFPHVDQLSPVLASANLGDGTASAACDESEAGLFATQANSITSTVGGPSSRQSSLILNETIPCDWRAPVFGNESIVAPDVAVHLQVDDASEIATDGLSSAQNASLAVVLDVSRAVEVNEHVVSSVAIPLDGQRLKAEFPSTLAGRNNSRSSGWKKPGAGKPKFLQAATPSSSPSQVYLQSLTVANAMETDAEVAPAPLNIRFRTKRKLAASSATPGQIENRRNVTMVNPTEQTGDDGVVNPSEPTNDDGRSETDGGKSSDDQSASGSNEGDDDDIRRKRAAMIRQSLARTAARKSSDRAKETSVGQRREGSATRYRRATEGGGTRLSDAIRRTARVSTILKEKTNDKTPPIPVVDPTSPKMPDEGPHNDFLLASSNTLSLSASRIQDAIGGMLDSMITQQPQDQLSSFLQNCASAVVATTTNFLPFNQTAAFSDFSRTSLWLLREWGISIDQEIFHRPFGLHDTDFGSLKQHGGVRETMMHPRQKYKSLVLDVNNGIVLRTATPSDDVDIANLRLSVFSDFSAELQNQFCARSCEALASRRRRGAVCVVATAATTGEEGERFSSTNNLRLPASFEHDNSNQILLGTAECSSHEFFGTRLGQRRRRHSLLYIAEVAVHPAARRRGVGRRLLESVESIARLMGSEADRNPQMRNKCVVETLFLHVDVQNHAAIAMYEKAGYRRVDSMYPMFLEFTTSLNLHPGATKGRDHYLLYKNLVEDPVWLPDRMSSFSLYTIPAAA
jgi:ribosomal protein S18 acetylase RimI-like enzyme